MHESKTECFLYDPELFYYLHENLWFKVKHKLKNLKLKNNDKIQTLSGCSTTREMVTLTGSACVFKIEARSITHSGQP